MKTNSDKIADRLVQLTKYSECLSRQTAAILYDADMYKLSESYNRAVEGVEPCTSRGKCFRRSLDTTEGRGANLERCIAMHAEELAVYTALKNGNKLQGAIIYCTDQPCIRCLKVLVEMGVHKVRYLRSYPVSLCVAAYDIVATQLDMKQMIYYPHIKDI